MNVCVFVRAARACFRACLPLPSLLSHVGCLSFPVALPACQRYSISVLQFRAPQYAPPRKHSPGVGAWSVADCAIGNPIIIPKHSDRRVLGSGLEKRAGKHYYILLKELAREGLCNQVVWGGCVGGLCNLICSREIKENTTTGARSAPVGRAPPHNLVTQPFPSQLFQ